MTNANKSPIFHLCHVEDCAMIQYQTVVLSNFSLLLTFLKKKICHITSKFVRVESFNLLDNRAKIEDEDNEND